MALSASTPESSTLTNAAAAFARAGSIPDHFAHGSNEGTKGRRAFASPLDPDDCLGEVHVSNVGTLRTSLAMGAH